MSLSTRTKLIAAIIISAFLTFLIAFAFIYLSEAGTASPDPGDIREIVIALDGTEWETDSSSRNALSSLFLTEFPRTLQIDRAGDESMYFTFGEFSVVVSVIDDVLGGIINGFPFSVSISRSHTGEGEAVSILCGETIAVYYR